MRWSKAVLLFLFFFLCSFCVVAQTKVSATKPLNNRDIIEMVKLGLGEDVVIAKIRAEKKVAFDTSVDGMKTLKAAHVPEGIIKAMISPAPEPPKEVADSGNSSLALSPLFARQAYLFHERIEKLEDADLSDEGRTEFQFSKEQLESDLKRTKEFDLQTEGDRKLMEMVEHALLFVAHERHLVLMALAAHETYASFGEERVVGCLMATEETIKNRVFDPNEAKPCTIDATVNQQMQSESSRRVVEIRSESPRVIEEQIPVETPR